MRFRAARIGHGTRKAWQAERIDDGFVGRKARGERRSGNEGRQERPRGKTNSKHDRSPEWATTKRATGRNGRRAPSPALVVSAWVEVQIAPRRVRGLKRRCESAS